MKHAPTLAIFASLLLWAWLVISTGIRAVDYFHPHTPGIEPKP